MPSSTPYALLKVVRTEEDETETLELSREALNLAAKLEEALNNADAEYKRLASQYPKEFLKLYLAPHTMAIDKKELGLLAKLLGLSEPEAGVAYARVVRRGAYKYRVWVTLCYCG